MTQSSEPMEWYKTRFDLNEKSLNGGAASAFHALRRKGMERFSALGFPTTRHEEWRYTNLAPLSRMNFDPAPAANSGGMTKTEISRYMFDGLHTLVFVNGRFDSSLSDQSLAQKGVTARSLASMIDAQPLLVSERLGRVASFDQNAFTALNTAFVEDGAYIEVDDGRSVDGPVHLLFISTANNPSLISPRVVVRVGKHARLAIVESYASGASLPCWTNGVTEILAEEGATIDHLKIQTESKSAFHISSTQVLQKAGSVGTFTSVVLGGAIVRNTVGVVLDAEGCHSTLNGLALATGTQLIDNHTSIDHAKAHCESHELYKSILDGNAHGVFNGKIFVRKDAQKTDAKQTNRTLLLSDDATIDTKPQLEIFADDVKCTHGAAVGQLDEDQIFYLRTRGIDRAAARDLLTVAFANEVVGRISIAAVRNRMEELVREQLRLGRQN